MDYLSHNVAVNLKRIRTSKGMSLDVVAEQTGVSKSMLAQIEKGKANPSLGVLGKIISGLRIEFQELIEAPPMESCLVTPEEMIPTKEISGKYKVWTCFPYEDNHQVEIYRIDIEPGGEYISGSHGEKTREYLAVSEGEITVECHGNIQQVNKKQVYRFETDQTHIYRNQTDKRASFMCFFVDYR
ncbi:helix-turn-helix domain-containing protein [Anaerostipes sp. MSJ-23]|uniref:helix-turn-helix domain-containing protein n=1 Tax=Anaerostipes sp. MSJ-23 TaxID=2841520 RepID=UPI001C11B5F9|nr:helix-turn-helix transcriptional regulator [Anaerostipes sp. MSJ-23]MBU5460936.1 helix-turn-helix domain-containing protein [Anaerostipes sp. MSJ-23]